MKFIYNLSGFNLTSGYCFENINFTSKKKALHSLAYIREHWVKKLDLDISNVVNTNTTDDVQFIVDVDEQIRIVLTKRPIYTQVVKYV